MSRLSDLSKDKVTVMERLIDSQNICKALAYKESNFLDMPDVKDAYKLIYNNIFPFRFIPDIDKDMETYITLSFGRYKPIRNTFKSGIIYIYAFTNIDLIRTDYGVLRTDFLISEIDSLVNSSRGIGIGKVEFYEMDEFILNNKYLGNYIAYKLYEFN